jgi:hypothetical protein
MLTIKKVNVNQARLKSKRKKRIFPKLILIWYLRFFIPVLISTGIPYYQAINQFLKWFYNSWYIDLKSQYSYYDEN